MNKNFLSKKSWHTGSIQHMEKVWKAEQRTVEEERKVTELRRQLAEEQKILDMKKLHEEATGKKSGDRLEWMYSVKKGPSTEEYLLGKPLTEKEEDKELEQLAKKPGSLWTEGNKNSALDAVAKVKDDPLLVIRQQEQQALKSIITNPLKMKKIKESKDVQKLLKKIKKQDKKDKKEKKKKQQQEESSRSASTSNDLDNNTATTERGASQEDNKKEEPTNRKRSRSRSRSPRRHRDSNRDSHRDSHSRRDRRSRSRSRSPQDHKFTRPNGNGQSNNRGGYRGKPRISEEDRQRRLAEMVSDANKHEEQRYKRIRKDKEEDLASDPSKNDHPEFIDQMNAGVYTGSHETLEDRINRNIHFIQRNVGTKLADDEKGIV